MSQKITRAARAAISEAVTRAHGEGSRQVREEHLLAAVLSDPAGDTVLRSVSPDLVVDAVLAEVERARRRAGLSAAEAEALAGMGIDLDEVVGRVEATLGEGALAPAVSESRSGWRGPKVSPEFQRVLLASRRQALARGDRALDVEHLLLGLLAQPGLAADALARHAVSLTAVLSVIEARDALPGARP
jgi:ATP-dependent Clp protease ATP-binding subunit ClpA